MWVCVFMCICMYFLLLHLKEIKVFALSAWYRFFIIDKMLLKTPEDNKSGKSSGEMRSPCLQSSHNKINIILW